MGAPAVEGQMSASPGHGCGLRAPEMYLASTAIEIGPTRCLAIDKLGEAPGSDSLCL